MVGSNDILGKLSGIVKGLFNKKFPRIAKLEEEQAEAVGPCNNWRGCLGLPGATATVPTYLLDYIYVYFLYPHMFVPWKTQKIREMTQFDFFFCLGGAD